MPTLDLFGHRDVVEIVEYDHDGSCTIRFSTGGTLITRVADLEFGPGEALPGERAVRGVTLRQRAYLAALLKTRDQGGLTDAELQPVNGMTRDEARTARLQLAAAGLVRCGLKKRGMSWPWEITVAGEHALATAVENEPAVAGHARKGA